MDQIINPHIKFYLKQEFLNPIHIQYNILHLNYFIQYAHNQKDSKDMLVYKNLFINFAFLELHFDPIFFRSIF